MGEVPADDWQVTAAAEVPGEQRQQAHGGLFSSSISILGLQKMGQNNLRGNKTP